MIPPQWYDVEYLDEDAAQLVQDWLCDLGRIQLGHEVTSIYIRPVPVERFRETVNRVAFYEWPREGIRRHRDTVESLVSCIHNGYPLAPILLRNGTLIDGFHRLAAAMQCKVTTWQAFDVQLDPFLSEERLCQ